LEYFQTKREQLNQEFKTRADKQAELKRRLDELKRHSVLCGPKEALLEAYKNAT
jgi:predicted nuclease with TOPRIM domain